MVYGSYLQLYLNIQVDLCDGDWVMLERAEDRTGGPEAAAGGLASGAEDIYIYIYIYMYVFLFYVYIYIYIYTHLYDICKYIYIYIIYRYIYIYIYVYYIYIRGLRLRLRLVLISGLPVPPSALPRPLGC